MINHSNIVHHLLNISQKLMEQQLIEDLICWRFRFSHVNVLSIEYSSKFSETKGNLWFYSKDEATNFNADIANANNFKFF